MKQIKNYLNKKRWIAFLLTALISFLIYLCFSEYTFAKVLDSFTYWYKFKLLISTFDFWLGIIIASVLQFLFFFWITFEFPFSLQASLPVYGPFFQLWYTKKKLQQKTSIEQ